MIYLASPYSHIGPGTEEQKAATRERRYKLTMFAQAKLFNLGYPIFATIVHNHKLACKYNLPTDAGFWSAYNHGMLDLSKALFVLQLPGWQDSLGVKDEIDYARRREKPIFSIPVTPSPDGENIELHIPIIPELQTLLRPRLVA